MIDATKPLSHFESRCSSLCASHSRNCPPPACIDDFIDRREPLPACLSKLVLRWPAGIACRFLVMPFDFRTAWNPAYELGLERHDSFAFLNPPPFRRSRLFRNIRSILTTGFHKIRFRTSRTWQFAIAVSVKSCSGSHAPFERNVESKFRDVRSLIFHEP